MFVEMSCQCGAAIQMDGVNDTYTMLMSSRFANAHTVCGYMSSAADETGKARRDSVIKPKIKKEDNED
jgi:hypothetical protein